MDALKSLDALSFVYENLAGWTGMKIPAGLARDGGRTGKNAQPLFCIIFFAGQLLFVSVFLPLFPSFPTTTTVRITVEKQLQAAQAGGKVTRPGPEPKKGNECKFMQKVIKSTVVLFCYIPCLPASLLPLPLFVCLVIGCLGLLL